MPLVKKSSNFIVIALLMGVLGCGMPVAQPRAVADDSYLLSFTRASLVEPEPVYHFQLCRRQAEAETGEQACFNPFEDVEGDPRVFAALPTAGNLRTKGIAGKALRYTTGTAAVLLLGAFVLVLPKAVRIAAINVLKLHKTAVSKQADDVIKRMAEVSAAKAARKASSKAAKRGKEFNHKQYYDKHYSSELQRRTAGLSIFKSKPALFFASLFIVEGTIQGLGHAHSNWKDINSYLAQQGWGNAELELVEALPSLLSGEEEPYRVAKVKRLLETLRKHEQLIFSADYLRAFGEENTDKERPGHNR